MEPMRFKKRKKIKKGYIWVFVGMNSGLVYFFYDDGSRAAEVFEQHIKGFTGAVADGCTFIGTCEPSYGFPKS